jgi:hypothetical protein
MKLFKLLCVFVLSALALSMTSCGGSNGDEKGSLSLTLSDDPTLEYKALYVTIQEVQVHRADDSDGQWTTVLTPHATFNLLELINGSTDPIGIADLPTGTYTQMRLIPGTVPDTETNILGQPHPHANYLVTSSDEYRELKIPSGFATGIKLVHTFEIESGLTTDLVLDFDAAHSVVKAGNSIKAGSGRKWLLKPIIKVIDTVENATVNGTITDQTQNTLSRVHVSAQVYNASGATEPEKVTIVASTITDDTGGYQMYLEPGTYLIIASAEGYSPACKKLIVTYHMNYSQNFSLSTAAMGTVTLKLNLLSGQAEEAATIEFRQTSPCDGTKQITVKTVNFSESGSYAVDVPSSTYSVVATYAGQSKIIDAVQTGTTLTISFTTH